MQSILYRGFYYVFRYLQTLLNPRAIAWRRLKKHQPNKPIITKLGKDLKVRVYPHDIIGENIYVQGVFEPNCWNFVKKFLKPGMIVFDLGANLGQYTLLSSKNVGKTGHVHSFEPSSRMFNELEFNVSLNELSDICTLNNAAVSDISGTAKLSKYEPGYEVFASLGSQARESTSIVGHEEVKTIRLDDYIESAEIDHVDFMKIDIEGAELLALRGAEKLLSQKKSPAILLELADINTDGFGYKAIEIWDYLEHFGYSIYSLGKKGILSKQSDRPLDFTTYQDVVAIKSDDGVYL